MKRNWKVMVGFIVLLVSVILFAENVYDTDAQRKLIGGYGSSLIAQATQAYEIDAASDSVTYFRYTGADGKVFIKKIVTTGTVTSFLKANDTWANRATATYTPIND